MKRIPYIPEPTPPKMISPRKMFVSSTAPPSGVIASWPAMTAPVDVTVVPVANSADLGDAEADLLVGHVAAGLAVPLCVMFTPELRSTCGAVLLGGVDRPDADREEDEHRGEDRERVAACRGSSGRT